jgi:HEAT repeat protein
VLEPTSLEGTPAVRVAELVDLVGRDAVVAWCADLLAGRAAHDDPDLPALGWLGGRATPWLTNLEGDRLRLNAYWVRVWAARGLLHCYQPAAARDVVAALGDEAWRVRETAAKVVATWEVGEAADRLVPLLEDDVPRVRAAAARGLGVVGEGEHARALHQVADDPEQSVRRAAETALRRLRQRLDRDV